MCRFVANLQQLSTALYRETSPEPLRHSGSGEVLKIWYQICFLYCVKRREDHLLIKSAMGERKFYLWPL